MAGDGKDGDTDANVWYGGQDSFGTRGYRRSRSQHVVHEEDVFAAQTPGPAHGKDTPYILPPLPVLLERLARIVPVAAHAVDIHRHAEALRNAAGDVRVRVLYNECDARLPLDGGPYYEWEALKRYCERLYE